MKLKQKFQLYKYTTVCISKLVLLNILYHLHELGISHIEFRFTLIVFDKCYCFFIDDIESQFNGIINKVLLMNFSLT